MPNVTIHLQNDTPSPTPIEGSEVYFYTTTGVLETSGTTNSSGDVTVVLPIAFYNVFLYKRGMTVLPEQPQQIEVLASPATNTFLIEAHQKVLPESIDPLRCTVSGYILGVDGGPANTRLIFETCKQLLVLDGNVITPSFRVETSSDENGYFEFELLRNTKYDGYFEQPRDLLSMTPGKLDIITPDQPGVKLDVLLFPVPIHLDFSVNAITLTAGVPQDETTSADISFSDGSTRITYSTPWSYISLQNTDNTVVEAFFAGEKLCLKPLSPGTATITSTRRMNGAVTILPIPDYTSESIVVTVV